MKPTIAGLLLVLCAARVGQAQTITTQFTLGNATAKGHCADALRS